MDSEALFSQAFTDPLISVEICGLGIGTYYFCMIWENTLHGKGSLLSQASKVSTKHCVSVLKQTEKVCGIFLFTYRGKFCSSSVWLGTHGRGHEFMQNSTDGNDDNTFLKSGQAKTWKNMIAN